MKGFTIIFRIFMLFVLLSGAGVTCPVKAETVSEGPILLITSYNPETRSMSDNLSAFMNEYLRLGGKHTPIVESMECKNLTEAYLWKSRMASILGKYKEANRPALVILLGQEAWSAYLSQGSDIAKETPSICGVVSANGLLLPDHYLDMRTWEPESKNVYTDFTDYNIVAGYVCEYDVDKNIELMHRLYPQMTRVAFISDNTYGGVSMQALVKKEMKKYPDLETIWLDGRTGSFMEISEKMRHLPDSTCVLLGTWRVDCTESYVIGNTTYMLRDANPALPVFTIASVGLGHWALGGYIPQYHVVGKKIASAAYEYLDQGEREGVGLVTIPGNYSFDVKRLHEFKLDSLSLPEGAVLVNKTPSFYEQYKYWAIGIVSAFIFLIACFLIAVYYIVRINHLKRNLEISGEELRVARDKAEEANRLKSAFLANMSHEIRTPLNAIVGFSSVLVAGDSSPEEKEQYCDIIQKNSDLLLHLINDILDISRMESGKIKFVWEQCDVVELSRTALSTVECGGRTNASFRFESPVASLVIKTDTQRLKQVLINLLSNAAKFTPSGSIKLALAIDEHRHLLELSVSDTGCGIPSDKSDRVFERFEKLNEFSQGTGLGLAICKLIVENLGGKIWVDNNYTGGARFVFTHPLVNEQR